MKCQNITLQWQTRLGKTFKDFVYVSRAMRCVHFVFVHLGGGHKLHRPAYHANNTHCHTIEYHQ